MKTTSSLFTLILFVVVSCTPIKNNETAAGSTQNEVTDTVTTQIEETATSSPSDESVQSSSIDETVQFSPTVETAETFSGTNNKFPTYSGEVFTKDSLEDVTTKALVELLNQYDLQKLESVNSNYVVTYKVGNDGDDSTVDGKTTESKTWYHDSKGQLSAYTLTSESEAYDRVDDKKTINYLFVNGQLAAVYSYHLSIVQIYFFDREKIMVSQCPDCGVKITDEGSAPTLSKINQADVSQLTDEFFKEYDELLKDLKSSTNQKLIGDRYFLKKQKTWDDQVVYTVKYDIDQTLYNRLVGN
jgi:hypothetical protein